MRPVESQSVKALVEQLTFVWWAPHNIRSQTLLAYAKHPDDPSARTYGISALRARNSAHWQDCRGLNI
jgi:hypothetical protein